MKEKKLNPNWDIVRKALGKEPQTVDVLKNNQFLQFFFRLNGINGMSVDAELPFFVTMYEKTGYAII